MSEYSEAYQQATGKTPPVQYAALDRLFDAMKRGERLPPRGQQAVDAGLVAHALVDDKADPEHYRYYQWVIKQYLHLPAVNEMSAKLIGMAFVSANVLATDLPQPLTLNPWQAEKMQDWPLAAERTVIIENNGVFIWLHHLHPDWPLIDQGGNDFQETYLSLLARLVTRGLTVTYLGDLDATGVRIADTLKQALPGTSDFLAIQTPRWVLDQLSSWGKHDPARTRFQSVQDPDLKKEMISINRLGMFVEQEQLIGEYETRISSWLNL